jgi:hypothetical protein
MIDPQDTPEYRVDMAMWDLETGLDELSTLSHVEPDLLAREWGRLATAQIRLANIVKHFTLKEAAE